MNKRIYELVEQSRDLVQRKTMLGGDMYVPGPIERGDVNLEKFAELIVRECSKVITNGGYWHHITKGWHQATPPEIAKMVREHFGVDNGNSTDS